MGYRGFLFMLLASVACLIQCGDVLEDNISKKSMNLLSPSDMAVINDDTVSFWWNRISGATSYEFHLVSPSFTNPVRVIMDSITSNNLLTLKLEDGAYEWEVRALNSGYATDYFYRGFSIELLPDSIELDLTDLEFTLLTPQDEATLSEASVDFDWNSLDGAIRYRFWLATPTLTNPEKIIVDSTFTTSKISLMLAPGRYQWQVRAENESSNTNYKVRSFSVESPQVDDLSTLTIKLRAPADNLSITNNNINFWWDELNGAEEYELLIAMPSFDEDEIEALVFEEKTELNKLTVNLDSGRYEWGVRALNLSTQTELTIRVIHINTP